MQKLTLKDVQSLIDNASGCGTEGLSDFILERLPEDHPGKHLMRTDAVAAFIQEFAPHAPSIEEGLYNRESVISMFHRNDAQIRMNQTFNQQTHWVNGVQLPTVVIDYYKARNLEPVPASRRAAQALENQRTLIGMRKTEDLIVLKNMVDDELAIRQQEREAL